MHHRLSAATLAVVAAAALSGCGGGGGSSPAPAVQTPTPLGPSSSPCTSAAGSTPLGLTRRPSGGAPASDVVPNELYVTYRAGRTVDAVARGAGAERGFTIGGENGLTHGVVVLPAGADRDAAATSLRSQGDVVTVAPLHYRHVLACTGTANDQLFTTSDQWYLFRTSVATTTGTNDAWSLSHGHGVSVGVIDTGADLNNQDLSSKITFQESVVTTGGTQAISTAAGAAQDTNGHGTNVAGLVAAATNNGYGFAGVGWEVSLQIYRVFPPATATSDKQAADTADEARAIRDAVANGVGVINLSLGSPSYANAGFDQAEHDAVEFAISSGVTVVAAGGNEYGTAPSTDGSVPDFPAAYPGAIAVGASAVQDAVPNVYASITTENAASYSNSGVHLLAPGGDPSPTDTGKDMLQWIEGYSTTTAALPADQCSNSGGVCRALFAGTSQATPQVAATVALMQALKGGPRSLSPAQALTILQQSTDVLPAVSGARQGAGRLNAYKALLNTH